MSSQETVKFKLNTDLLRKAQKQAKVEVRTVASLVRYALELYLRGKQ